MALFLIKESRAFAIVGIFDLFYVQPRTLFGFIARSRGHPFPIYLVHKH